MTAAAERQQRHYENRIAQGFSKQSFWLSETARSALEKLHKASGTTRDEIVCMALLQALESNARPSDSDAGKRPKLAQPQLFTADPDPGPPTSESDASLSSESNVQASESHSTTSDLDTRSTSDSNGQSSDSDTPEDRRALAEIGHALRRQGLTNEQVAEDWNSRGWRPDRVPKAIGSAPRKDAPPSWTWRSVSQLLNRSYPEGRS